MGRKIQVRIDMTVEVDAEQWEMAYGIEGVKAIREDVKAQVRSLVEQGAASDAAVTVIR